MSTVQKDRLKAKYIFSGTIKNKTGLYIGGTNSSLEIGGISNAIIRNPYNQQPYIPGSTLKGKMRALLDLVHGTLKPETKMGKIKFISDDRPSSDGKLNIVAQLFGNSSGEDHQRPSRIIVRDAELDNPEDLLQKTELPYTELKTEVIICRITANAVPRQLERVPAGVDFNMKIVLNVFDSDDEKELITTLIKGLELLQDDYIGGNGTRGSGQIEFSLDPIIVRTREYYLGESEESVLDKEDLVEKFELATKLSFK